MVVKLLHGLGLVLAGGGGKGAYHIGIWKALQEFGAVTNITAVSGTSVGALNAALFVQGNYNIAENVWLNITKDKILKLDLKRVTEQVVSGFSSFTNIQKIDIAVPMAIYLTSKAKNSIFSRDGLIEIIDEALNLEYISSNSIPCFATCLEIPSLKKKCFNLQGMSPSEIKSVLLATSALPFIFNEEKVSGKSFVDGGIPIFGDNVPIKPLYDIGYRMFLVAHLSRDSIIDTKVFPDAKILQIVPHEHQGELLDGTLDFTRDGAQRRIQQGYEDTFKILKPLYDIGMVQNQIYHKLNKMAEDEYVFEERRNISLNERANLKKDLANIRFERKGK